MKVLWHLFLANNFYARCHVGIRHHLLHPRHLGLSIWLQLSAAAKPRFSGFCPRLFPWEAQVFHFCLLNATSNSSISLRKHQHYSIMVDTPITTRRCLGKAPAWLQTLFAPSSSFTCFSLLICLHSTPGCVVLSYIWRRSVCVCSHIKGGHKSLLRKNFYTKAIYSPQCSLIADNYELGQLSSCLWRGRYLCENQVVSVMAVCHQTFNLLILSGTSPFGGFPHN